MPLRRRQRSWYCYSACVTSSVRISQEAADHEHSALMQPLQQRFPTTGSELQVWSHGGLVRDGHLIARLSNLCKQCEQLCGLQRSYCPHTGLLAPLLPWGNVRTSAGRLVDPLQSALQNVIQIPCSSLGSCRVHSQGETSVRTLTSASRRPASGLRVRHPLLAVPAPNSHGSSWQQGEAWMFIPPPPPSSGSDQDATRQLSGTTDLVLQK